MTGPDRPALAGRRLDLQERHEDHHQGDRAERFYYLFSGQVKLHRVASDGQEKLVEVIREGESFAEALLFTGTPNYPVSATALKSSVIASLHGPQYRRMLEKHPSICLDILATLTIRLHQRLNEIDTLALAKKKFPGMYNSLDALCKRMKISLASRDKHGALIDAELLAAVVRDAGADLVLSVNSAQTGTVGIAGGGWYSPSLSDTCTRPPLAARNRSTAPATDDSRATAGDGGTAVIEIRTAAPVATCSIGIR